MRKLLENCQTSEQRSFSCCNQCNYAVGHAQIDHNVRRSPKRREPDRVAAGSHGGAPTAPHSSYYHGGSEGVFVARLSKT